MTVFIGQKRALLGGLKPPWLPSALFALSQPGFWFDFSDMTTMWQDAAGTIPVTALGDPVGRIIDKSGNNIVATQSTSSARPTLTQDALGAFGLSGDGVNDHLITSSIDFSGSNKMLAAAGGRKLSDAAIAVIGDFPSSAFHAVGFPRSSTITGAFVSSGAVERRGSSIAQPASRVVTALWDGDGADDAAKLRLRINGIPDGVISGSGASISFGSGAVDILRRGNGTAHFTGVIHQLVVRGGPPPDADELAQLEAYIAQKTGIAL